MSAPFFWMVLSLQCATYVVLGFAFLQTGNWRFGIVQLLLAMVQGIIYSAGAPT